MQAMMRVCRNRNSTGSAIRDNAIFAPRKPSSALWWALPSLGIHFSSLGLVEGSQLFFYVLIVQLKMTNIQGKVRNLYI